MMEDLTNHLGYLSKYAESFKESQEVQEVPISNHIIMVQALRAVGFIVCLS